MKAGNIQILDIDFEYKLWKNRLAYYADEIMLFQDRANVVAREHPEWQWDEKHNQLLKVQMERIINIQNKIRTQEQEMAFYAEDYPVTSDHSHYRLHDNLRNEMEKINLRQSEIIDSVFSQLCYPMTLSDSHVSERHSSLL